MMSRLAALSMLHTLAEGIDRDHADVATLAGDGWTVETAAEFVFAISQLKNPVAEIDARGMLDTLTSQWDREQANVASLVATGWTDKTAAEFGSIISNLRNP